MFKAALFAGACVPVFAWALWSPAHAADNPSGNVMMIDEVVVTAERREQSVQTTSLNIQVATPEALERAGVTQARDITKLAPGVQIGQGGPATQIYIRGVGDYGSTPTTNPAVATYVDGVYVARSNSIEGNFYDLERIEIVKGPQGTLYGRNATGGALNIITAKPQLGEYSGKIGVEVGSYSLFKGTGVVNIPLTDTLAVRAAFEAVNREGYADTGFDDDKHEAVRLSALWEPTDRFSLRMTADYAHTHGLGPAFAFKGPLAPAIATRLQGFGVTPPSSTRTNTTDPAVGQVLLGVAAANNLCIPNAVLAAARTSTRAIPLSPGPQGFCPPGLSSLAAPASAADAKMDNNFYNFSAEANWDLGFARLTVLPGYRRARNDYVTYPIITFFNSRGAPEVSESQSLEVRLGQTSDRLKWVAGLFYFREDQDASFSISPAWRLNGDSLQTIVLETESAAAFGQLTYSLTDKLRLIGGLRHTVDNRSIDGVSTVTGAYTALPYAPGQLCFNGPDPCTRDRFAGEREETSTNFRIGAEYDLLEKSMLFITYSTGQKAGGFNASSVLGTRNEASYYRPEKLAALEIGSRNRFLDSRVQLNLGAFYWKYDDQQASFAGQNAQGGNTFGYTNAGEATMYGVDADLIVKITANDTISAGVEYLDTEYDEFIYPSIALSASTTGCAITPPPAGSPFQSIDCSGRPLARAPKWSGTAAYTHEFVLSNGGRIDATLGAQFASSRYLGIDYIPATLADAYVVADASLTYHSPDKAWQVSAYVRNIGDETVYTGMFSQAQLAPSFVVASQGAPRTYGVRIGVEF